MAEQREQEARRAQQDAQRAQQDTKRALHQEQRARQHEQHARQLVELESERALQEVSETSKFNMLLQKELEGQREENNRTSREQLWQKARTIFVAS